MELKTRYKEHIELFLKEATMSAFNTKITPTELYRAYNAWFTCSGIVGTPLTMTSFSVYLKSCGVVQRRDGKFGRYFVDILPKSHE